MPKINDFHKDIMDILKGIGATPDADFVVDCRSEFELKLATSGIELGSIKDIDFTSYDGFAFYKDKQIVFYIRQPRDYKNKPKAKETNKTYKIPDIDKLPRFHLYKCSKIEEMIENERGYRYVATNKRDGIFEVEFNKDIIENRNLYPCQYCVNVLSTKYSYHSTKENFNINDFFEKAPHIINTFNPEYDDINLPPPDEYPANWKDIRNALITKRGKVCELCRTNLALVKTSLHLHHKNSKKHDNSESNLMILCEPCHKRIHSHMR